jgi:hypothetical protein
MALILRLAALILLLIGTGPAVARTAECSDDRGVDRCAPEQHRKVLELFGMQTIEHHRDRGDQVRRVFYVDGYGQDLLAIAFLRAPGRDPAVFVHYPQHQGEPQVEPLQALVPQSVWEDVLRRSAFFERPLAPIKGKTDDLLLCLHSWVYTVEANDPARPDGDAGSLRRKTADACGDGPAEAFSDEVQRAALALFPHCSRLDSTQYRNEVTQLSACRLLAGDRIAAAEVMNRAQAFRQEHGEGEVPPLTDLFAFDASIDWNGDRSPSQQLQAAPFWARKIAQAASQTVSDGLMNFRYLLFSIERVEGVSGSRVRLVGSLSRSRKGAKNAAPVEERARVEQIWVLASTDRFEVERATVGPWQPDRP